MKRLKITVVYLDNKEDTYEADHLITEGVQWRIDRDDVMIFLPMVNVRCITLERNS